MKEKQELRSNKVVLKKQIQILTSNQSYHENIIKQLEVENKNLTEDFKDLTRSANSIEPLRPNEASANDTSAAHTNIPSLLDENTKSMATYMKLYPPLPPLNIPISYMQTTEAYDSYH